MDYDAASAVERKRPVVLVVVGYYVPGFKAGGILSCVLNIVNHLHLDYDFRIITRDRDLGDLEPYPNIARESWQKVGKAHVYYLPPSAESLGYLRRLVRSTPHDAVYLNGFFDGLCVKALVNRRFGSLEGTPIVLTPHGEFAWPALRQKYIKKTAFICLARLIGLHRDVTWHASSHTEAEATIRVMKVSPGKIQIALQLPPTIDETLEPIAARTPVTGTPGVRIVFLSRIAPAKNLDFALRVLARVRANVSFDIVGPVENAAYWAECEVLMRNLPENVTSRLVGPIQPSEVIKTLAQYDLMLFPSRSESYGQVIAESLIAGTPVLIGMDTPWRDLQAKGIGWDLPLDDPQSFARVVDEIAATSDGERADRRVAVREKFREMLSESTSVGDIRRLFNSVLQNTE